MSHLHIVSTILHIFKFPTIQLILSYYFWLYYNWVIIKFVKFLVFFLFPKKKILFVFLESHIITLCVCVIPSNIYGLFMYIFCFKKTTILIILRPNTWILKINKILNVSDGALDMTWKFQFDIVVLNPFVIFIRYYVCTIWVWTH